MLVAGVQMNLDADVTFNSIDGNGVLVQTLQHVAPGAFGAFTVSPVPLGIRSVTITNVTGFPATIFGPYIINVEQADTQIILKM